MTEIVALGFGVSVFYLIFRLGAQMNRLSMQMKRTNDHLDRMAQHMGLPEHPINEELRELVREGRMVEAVKRTREVFGLSLVEAKQYVDGL
ncbi:hypothetical protein [Bacillus sp. es.036]|uniref:hypothetical protein n=1 Tax=Bacillus sp. es.036 TaxID=1761764 RepID=UPI000BF2DA9C|nr:hypothetical protein [Bacillus sp. es.036]PFG12238.1 MutS-like protein [Bacillus sp. es.036]